MDYTLESVQPGVKSSGHAHCIAGDSRVACRWLYLHEKGQLTSMLLISLRPQCAATGHSTASEPDLYSVIDSDDPPAKCHPSNTYAATGMIHSIQVVRISWFRYASENSFCVADLSSRVGSI